MNYFQRCYLFFFLPMSNKIIISHLTSTYQKLPVCVYIKQGNLGSRTALILHGGAFEKAFGDTDRYKHILLWLQKNMKERPHIVWYQTARKPDPKIIPALRLNYWQEIFQGKVFGQELDDVEKVYKFILTKRTLFPKKINKIYSLGFSLGGTLAIILSSKFPQVVKLCAIGSAISTKRKNLPVLRGYPSKKWILSKFENFSGYFKVLQGYAEEIVPINDALLAYSSLKNPKFATYSRIQGVNHMFSGKNIFGLVHAKKILKELIDFYEFEIPLYG